MKTRDEIIQGMCYTTRHDYGLVKHPEDDSLSSGMTPAQRKALYSEMSQVFTHNFEDIYVNALRYEKLRKLNVPQFKELYIENLKGVASFDELVDSLPL